RGLAVAQRGRDRLDVAGLVRHSPTCRDLSTTVRAPGVAPGPGVSEHVRVRCELLPYGGGAGHQLPVWLCTPGAAYVRPLATRASTGWIVLAPGCCACGLEPPFCGMNPPCP